MQHTDKGAPCYTVLLGPELPYKKDLQCEIDKLIYFYTFILRPDLFVLDFIKMLLNFWILYIYSSIYHDVILFMACIWLFSFIHLGSFVPYSMEVTESFLYDSSKLAHDCFPHFGDLAFVNFHDPITTINHVIRILHSCQAMIWNHLSPTKVQRDCKTGRIWNI